MVDSSIAPGLLIAVPQLKDPNFEHTVILLIEHDDEEGALGLVINKATDVDLATVLSEIEIDAKGAGPNIGEHPPLLRGGPVSPERGWIVHSADWQCSETQTIAKGICVTTSLEILTDIAAGEGPSKYRFCLGYSGWGPKQLVDEIKTGAWLNMALSADLVFDIPLEGIWSTCFERLGIDPTKLVGLVGDV